MKKVAEGGRNPPSATSLFTHTLRDNHSDGPLGIGIPNFLLRSL